MSLATLSAVPVVPISKFGLWIRAARPRTLTIAVSPVIVGAALAWREVGAIAWLPVLTALVVAIAIQIGTNLMNDAADGARGHDGPGRLGPLRVTAAGLLDLADVRRAGFIAFAVAGLAGLHAVHVGGWPILAIGIASVVAGLCYSNGPRPIAFTPFGEAFVVAFFGVAAVVGTALLAGAGLSAAGVLLGVALGLPAAAVLMVNNHRDRDADQRNGRRTLAIVIGPHWSAFAYAVMLLAPILIMPVVADLLRAVGFVAVILLLAPAAFLMFRFTTPPIGIGLNRLLALTALYQLALAIVVTLALMV